MLGKSYWGRIGIDSFSISALKYPDAVSTSFTHYMAILTKLPFNVIEPADFLREGSLKGCSLGVELGMHMLALIA